MPEPAPERPRSVLPIPDRLTGRDHHAVGMGGITEIATSAPGYSSIRPKTAAPLAETLKLNGYSTAQFGKCREMPVWETSPLGPFDAWPTGGGGTATFYVDGTEVWVEIDLGDDADDADHLIGPDERLRIAMARQ